MARNKQMYWLVRSASKKHEARARYLKSMNIEVCFFASSQMLIDALKKKRTNIIMISDNASTGELANDICDIISQPEANGVRLLLSLETFNQDIMKLAAGSNFRDFIPFQINKEQWLYRLLYSTAGKPVAFSVPESAVNVNHISALNIPGRLIWINANRIRIESSVSIPVGANFYLGGPIAEELGEQHVNVTVKETHKSHLTYRFSEALIGEWSITKRAQAKAESILNEKAKLSSVPECRIYVGAKSAHLRNGLIDCLDPALFELKFALQIAAITLEPQFYSPDIIFLEDSVCTGAHADRLAELLRVLDTNVPIVIFGDKRSESMINRLHHRDNLFVIDDIPDNLGDKIYEEFGVKPEPRKNQDGYIYFQSEDPLSFVQVNMPARLTQVHPKSIQISLPFKVKQFSLGQFPAPFIKKVTNKNPWIKTTEVKLNPNPDSRQFPFLARAFLVDLESKEQQNLASAIVKYIDQYFKKLEENLLTALADDKERAKQKAQAAPVQSTNYIAEAKAPPLSAANKTLEHQAQASGYTDYSQIKTRASYGYSSYGTGSRTPSIPVKKRATSRTAKKEQSLSEILSSKQAKQWYTVLALIAMMGVFMWAVFTQIEPGSSRSGTWFNQQLEKFAPATFEESLRKAREGNKKFKSLRDP